MGDATLLMVFMVYALLGNEVAYTDTIGFIGQIVGNMHILILFHLICRYTLNIWDVGGQKTIRSYWRNYFEQTDGLVWVVDSSDLRRLDDCKMELDNLLKEEVLSSTLDPIYWLIGF